MPNDLPDDLKARVERDTTAVYGREWVVIYNRFAEWARDLAVAQADARAATQTARGAATQRSEASVAATIGEWRKALEKAQAETREARRAAGETLDTLADYLGIPRAVYRHTHPFSWERTAEGAGPQPKEVMPPDARQRDCLGEPSASVTPPSAAASREVDASGPGWTLTTQRGDLHRELDTMFPACADFEVFVAKERFRRNLPAALTESAPPSAAAPDSAFRCKHGNVVLESDDCPECTAAVSAGHLQYLEATVCAKNRLLKTLPTRAEFKALDAHVAQMQAEQVTREEFEALRARVDDLLIAIAEVRAEFNALKRLHGETWTRQDAMTEEIHALAAKVDAVRELVLALTDAYDRDPTSPFRGDIRELAEKVRQIK